MATTNLSYYDKATIPNAKSFRFGIVVSEWNPEITRKLAKGAIETLIDCGAIKENYPTSDQGRDVEKFINAAKYAK